MRYLLLLWGDEDGEAALGADGRRAIVEAHGAFHRRLRGEGKLVLGEPLEPRSKLLRGGLVTDGPFTETKEQLGGVYVIDVANEDEALDWARRVPDSPGPRRRGAGYIRALSASTLATNGFVTA